MHSRIARVACAALLLAGGVSACGSLPQIERKKAHALADNSGTRLGQAVLALVGARIGLVRAASRTLDVQYYIFHPDDTDHAFLGELLSAANRGVRVRLLLDDIHTARLERILVPPPTRTLKSGCSIRSRTIDDQL